jgi:hypothetical protein
MNEIETTVIFTLLSTAYPRAYKDMTDQEVDATISLWQAMFSDTPVEKVKTAVTLHIVNSKWQPSIAEIKEYISKMDEPSQVSGIDAWQLVRKAVQQGEYVQGGYDYTKAFNALPALVRRVVGDKAQLRSWAMSDESEFENFAQTRFLTNYEKQSKAQAEFGRLPGMVQADVARLAERNTVPLDNLLAEAKQRCSCEVVK